MFFNFSLYHSIPNSLDPAWTHVFETEYKFGQETKFTVGILDDVGTSGKEKSMGSAVFEVGEVLAARGSGMARQLKDGGTIHVRVTRATGSKGGMVQGKFRGVKLSNVDGLLGKSDPFYTISAQINAASGRTWQPVYRSETIDNNLNPVWDSFTLPLDKLCGGNKDLPLLIEVSDWEKSGKHKLIGSVEITVHGLVFLMGSSDRKLPLIDKNNKTRGSLQLDSLHISDEGAPAVDPNIQPKKFVKVNGINKLNPEYQKWKDAQTA